MIKRTEDSELDWGRSASRYSRTVRNGQYPEEGLLRNTRRKEERFGGRHPQGVPQAGAQVPSRRQSRGQVSRREVQVSLRSQRRSQRSQEAQDLRSGRLLLRQHRPGDGGGLCSRGWQDRQGAEDFPEASPARARWRPGRSLRFWRLRFLRPGRQRQPGPQVRRRRRRRKLPRHLRFDLRRRARRSSGRRRPGARHRPRISGQCSLLDGDPRRRHAPEHLAPRRLCEVPRPRTLWRLRANVRSATAPARSRRPADA